MTSRLWIRTLFGHKVRPLTGRRPRGQHAQLALEALEDRLAPATFTVANLNDSGTGSLRQAVLDANNTAGANLINFQSGLTGTITLTSGALSISNDVSIQGPGANVLTVSGGHTTGVFFLISGGTHGFSFPGLTIANGSTNFGGGMNFSLASGTLTIENCVFSGNRTLSGGGLFADGNGASATTVNISDTTFCNNQALVAGAAFLDNSTSSLTNCTISSNTATNGYGGLVVIAAESGATAALALTNCTIAGNSGPGAAGLQVQTLDGTSASASYVNTLFANSASGSPNIGIHSVLGNASVTSLGYNLSDDGSSNLTGPGDQPNTNPLLGALGNYGGSTPTLPLLPGSPAIDAGTATGAPLTDQRGVSRMDGVEIGAFESRGFTVSIAGGNNQQVLVNTAFGTALTVQVSSAFSEPVQGGMVTFNAPGNGASATFPNGNGTTINATGQASLSVDANATAGSYSVSAAASGAEPVNFSLTNLTAITLSPTMLPDGSYGSPYSQTITATGGAGGPYTFMVTMGSLPAGLMLDSNGMLKGTPTRVGTSAFLIQATDSGHFLGSLSYIVTIVKASTSAVVTSSANPAAHDQLVTFAVTVSSGLPAPFTPTGMVQFQIDGQNAGTPLPLSGNGTATYSTAALTPGSHSITASYTGDSNFAAGLAPTFTQVILAPGISLVGTTLFVGGGTTSNDQI
jgi:hypothetical protein